jgi:hypothetical protein
MAVLIMLNISAVGNWFAISEPGDTPTIHPQNPNGAFMRLIKQDRRYQLNPGYLFFTTIIAGDELGKVITT